MICIKCGGPWLPETGFLFRSGIPYCGRCKRKVFGAFLLPDLPKKEKEKENPCSQ